MAETKSRRRGVELEQAILEAAWAELTEVGYGRLTMEAVATRAGTSKPVIYRRWPSRAELVLASWTDRQGPRSRPTAPPIDTGSLRADLVALFGRVGDRLGNMMSEAIAGVMSETFRHPEISAVLRAQLKAPPLAEAVRAIVQQAIDRGELPPTELPVRVLRLPIDLLRAEFMVCGEPDADTIGELVDEIYLPLLRGLAKPRQP